MIKSATKSDLDKIKELHDKNMDEREKFKDYKRGFLESLKTWTLSSAKAS